MKLAAAALLLSIATSYSSAFDSNSKSSKSKAEDCPPVPDNVTCGATYENARVITLGGHLVCNGNITEADGSRNAALTVSGNTVLDCQGNSISQVTKSTGAAVDCDVAPSRSNSTQTELMKRECGLFYEWGIIVKDGATVKNCIFRQFYGGISMEEGGTIQNSEVTLNRRGMQVANTLSNATQSKVVSSEFYNNGEEGIIVFQEIKNSGAEVLIEDVMSKNNIYIGIALSGTGITIRNVEARNNPGAGVLIFGDSGAVDPLTDITLDGQVSLNNNVNNGLAIGASAKGIVKVTGDLNVDRNKYDGVYMDNSTDVTVVLNKGSSSGKSGKGSSSGSIKACGNGFDIRNFGNGTFEGNDYTCNPTNGADAGGGDVPVCKLCYPSCSSSSNRVLDESASISAMAMVTEDAEAAMMGWDEMIDTDALYLV